RRRVYRPGVPLMGRHAGDHPAGNISGFAFGNGVVASRGGPAVCKGGGSDGVLRIGPERYNSFLEPAAARGAAGRGSGKSRGAGNGACRAALDSDVRGACVRSDRDGLLRSTVAAP